AGRLRVEGIGRGEEEQGVRAEEQRVREDRLAVAPEAVEDGERATPADLLPGLHRDAEDPARALADGRAQLAREVLARRDELLAGVLALAAHHRPAGEVAPPVREAELDADLVVFDEAVDIEGLLAALGRQLLERVAGEGASDPCGRDE